MVEHIRRERDGKKERERDTTLVSEHNKYRSKLNRAVQRTAVSTKSQQGQRHGSVPQCWDTTGKEVRRGREEEPETLTRP